MMMIFRNQKGQSTVELALVLPLFIFLLLAIMEGGRIFAGYLELQNVARNTVRFSAVDPTPTAAEATVEAKNGLNLLDSSKLKPIGFTSNSDWVTIVLEYDLDIATPIISDLIGSPFTIRSQMAMRRE